MELNEALLKRRSVRKYTSDPVSDEQIDQLLHAAMSGPSAMNKKPWKFYVISNKEVKNELCEASPYTHHDAPIQILVCGDLSKALPGELKDYWIQDCSAAIENILLRAVDLGLGTVWCGLHPNPVPVNNVRRILKLDDHLVPLGLIFVGHPLYEHESRDQYDENDVNYIK